MLMKTPKTNIQRLIATLESIEDSQFNMRTTLATKWSDSRGPIEILNENYDQSCLVGCIAGWALVTMTPEERSECIYDGMISGTKVMKWMGHQPPSLHSNFFGARDINRRDAISELRELESVNAA